MTNTFEQKTNKLYEQIHITTRHGGKMEGMQSISTNCLSNARCLQRCQNGEAVCSHCFAMAQFRYRANNVPVFEQNSRLLSESILPEWQLPRINALYFRFEAFGDIINENHIINYINICRSNPQTKFALWTKNPDIIAKAISDGHVKPDNLIIVYSSFRLNKAEDGIRTKYNFIDKVFTVYDSEESAKSNNVVINCGGKKCRDCLLCYQNNGVSTISELLK